jgi:hypothetical protein
MICYLLDPTLLNTPSCTSWCFFIAITDILHGVPNILILTIIFSLVTSFDVQSGSGNVAIPDDNSWYTLRVNFVENVAFLFNLLARFLRWDRSVVDADKPVESCGGSECWRRRH